MDGIISRFRSRVLNHTEVRPPVPLGFRTSVRRATSYLHTLNLTAAILGGEKVVWDVLDGRCLDGAWPWSSGASLSLALACSQQTDTRAPAASSASSSSAAAEGQLSARATETPKPDSTGQGPVRTLRTPTGPPPTVDTSIAGVPVEDVLFDTFRGGSVRLSEASEETIEALRDRIKPIYEPKYDSAGDGDWLFQGDGVLGYVSSSGNASPTR